MTTTPIYTDADVGLAHDAFAKAWTAHERMHPVPDVCTTEPAEDCCDRVGLRAALDALAAAGRITRPRPAPADEQPADRHGLTVDADGGWSVTHPDGCIVSTPTGPALICNVGDLAAEQRPAAQLPAGRYDVEANDLGDRLLIGDRLRDECTCRILDITSFGQPPGSDTTLALDPRCPLHGNRTAEG